MNRSMTNNGHAHTVRVDAFVAQMQSADRVKFAQAIDRQNMAELERASIARRIKQARQETGLSQPEMAEALGVIERTYQNYESVKKPRIPWGSMNDIAKITGKSTEWLIHGDAKTPDPFSQSGEASDIGQRLRDIQQALSVRISHDQMVDRLLEQQNQLLARQSEILTRIEALLSAVQPAKAQAPAGSGGFEVPKVPQSLRDALNPEPAARPQAPETRRKRGSGGRGA